MAVIDEAHTLPREIGKVLLNASQSVSAAAPFLLVLAGTPGLHHHLNSIEVDEAVVAVAAPAVGRSQSAYYQDRYDELERAELIGVAASVAEAFAGRGSLRREALNDAIAAALPEGPTDTTEVLQHSDRLSDLGHVWSPPGADDAWHPGIPSLMAYVKGQHFSA